MNGIPSSLNLTFLHGARLIQICLGQFELQFHFHPAGSISVEGGWEYLDPTGKCVDRRYEQADRPPYELHRLLGRQVLNTRVHAPGWFALAFEGGDELRIFDDNEQYESFQIQPGDQIV